MVTKSSPTADKADAERKKKPLHTQRPLSPNLA